MALIRLRFLWQGIAAKAGPYQVFRGRFRAVQIDSPASEIRSKHFREVRNLLGAVEAGFLDLSRRRRRKPASAAAVAILGPSAVVVENGFFEEGLVEYFDHLAMAANPRGS